MNLLRRIWKIVSFFPFYARELVTANVRIAIDVLTPGTRLNPGFIAIPLTAKSDLELLAFANLVTMTPGTLSLDISPDRRTLYVHVMYLDDIEAARDSIATHLQTRILEILR